MRLFGLFGLIGANRLKVTFLMKATKRGSLGPVKLEPLASR